MNENFKSFEVLQVWDGTNYIGIVRAITERNTEILIQVSKKRLIIRDPKSNFYACVPKGEPVRIPKYEQPIIEEDPPIEEFEETKTVKTFPLSEEQIRLHKEWGLIEREEA